MATKSISQLDTQATANETDLFEVAIVDANSASGYASKKESAAAIADAIVGSYQYPLRITGTTAKTIAGAINELKNLVDLLPQFAIEVVQTLPVSDISETTIYLVPASDPEQGNYYEEYIYVNNAWELVGTTAVDLSGYYTSAQVDTLLAAKADTSSLATVATSGAYSDLSGKPTIDTALDDASTNAVENRAVASEINSIKSDITVEGSASGDIATFVDGSDNPLKELKISIIATQQLWGVPSPSNERGIVGYSGCSIANSKNDIYDSTGTIVQGSTHSRKHVDIISSKSIKVYTTGTAGFSYMSSKQELSDYALTTGKTYAIYANVTEISENATPAITIRDSDNTIQEAAFMQDIGYHGIVFTYNPTIHNYISFFATWETSVVASVTYDDITFKEIDESISWEETAGTVYGGTIDVKNGVLTVTHAIYTFDGSNDENWVKHDSGSASAFAMRISIANAIKSPTSDSLLFKCNYLQPAKVNDTWGNFHNFVSSTVSTQIICGIDTITTVEEWKTYLAEHPLQVVCELVTPTTYQLTPTEIRSLLGVNNVWANCGAITELKYTRDLNLCINDIIARIEALEGASNTRSLSLSPTLTKSLTSDSDTAEGKTEETEETKEEAQNER